MFALYINTNYTYNKTKEEHNIFIFLVAVGVYLVLNHKLEQYNSPEEQARRARLQRRLGKSLRRVA